METRTKPRQGRTSFRRRAWQFATCSAVLAAVIAPRTWSQGTTASSTGLVSDSTGSAVPDAEVTVRNLETNVARSAKSSNSGNYSVPLLPPGHYSVTVSHEGFQTYQQSDVLLAIGQVADIPAALNVGQVSDQVTVISGAPVIQTADSS